MKFRKQALETMPAWRSMAWLALALCAFASLSRADDTQKLVIATEGAYPPYNFVAADGTLQGFDVDIAKALCDELKAHCSIIKHEWSKLIPGLVSREYDLVVASMAIIPQREEIIDFSIPYYQSPSALIAQKSSGIRADANGWIDRASVKDRKIGVQRNTAYETFARTNWPEAIIVAYDTPEVADIDMKSGVLDARLDDYMLLRREFLSSGQSEQFQRIGRILGEKEFGSKGQGIGMRKGENSLREAVNKAILQMRADGTYSRINDKYFDFDIYGQ